MKLKNHFIEIEFRSKLKNLKYRRAAKEIAPFSKYLSSDDLISNSGYNYISLNVPNDIDLLKEAGVLDIWFEPVYAPEKPKEEIISMGSFDLKVTSEGIFHKSENITKFVEGIETWWKNVLNNGNLKFSNYDFLIPSSNIIIEKSGCERSQTKLSQWLDVWNKYQKLKK